MSSRRLIAGVIAWLGALLGAGPAVALAHPLLLQAAPTPGLVAPKAPDAIRLAVSETAVARGSSIVVTGPRGTRVPTSAVTVKGRTASVTPKRPLRPAVYRVRWSVLGNDGHLVSGTFDFGVAGANGAAPPGAERLVGASAAYRGAEDAVSDGFVRVLGRWLGILAAALILGLFLLARRLGRATDLEAAWITWWFVVLAAFEGVLAAAQSGADGSLDLGLLTASATGKADLVRGVVVVVVSLLALRVRAALLAGSVAVLLSYALSGHALVDPSFWALLDQGVHVLAASVWLGGVIAIAVVGIRARVAVAEAVRAYAPVAVGALGVAVVTGVLAAVREVDTLYFLRWSGYGNVVLVKAALVAVVMGLGYLVWRRGSVRVLRAEALGVAGILALAAALSGLAQGRGQPVPAERGTLFPGPAFATALLDGANAAVTLAPARTGDNVVAVDVAPEAPTPRRVSVRLACACAEKPVTVALTQRAGATFSAHVPLQVEGTWYGYVSVDGTAAAAPVQLTVGLPMARGSTPLDVLAIADLSGPDAERCRAHLAGVEMAIARINGSGGLDGGRKVAVLGLDSHGDPTRARGLAREASSPLAFVGCGAAAEQAAGVMAGRGVPTLVGDPGVAPLGRDDVFRLAADPYAQGVAFAQLIKQRVGDALGRPVRFAGTDARLRQGLAAGLGSRYRVVDSALTGSPRQVARLLGRVRSAAVVVDGAAAAAAVASAGRAVEGIAPGPLLVSERSLGERLVRSAGSLGRIGAVQGLSEVSPTTQDGILYKQAVPQLFRGELASLDGLRGYVTGLALRDAVRDGIDPEKMRAALRAPRVFSDALLAPWSPASPGLGSASVVAIQPQFLSPTLVPAKAGGESQDPSFFPDGTWAVTTGKALGLPPGKAGPPLSN